MAGGAGRANSVTSDDESIERVARRYGEYATRIERSSALYAGWARGIAGDQTVARLVASLPPTKQQPVLVFAAARRRFGTPDDWDGLRQELLDDFDAVRAEVAGRSTQVNEPRRCATLLPVLARLPQPLALIEVGASAGLCLLPDRYRYQYGDQRIEPGIDVGVEAPLLRCRASAATPIPQKPVEVVWRRGLDLAPVSLDDVEHLGWLETLIPPDDNERLERLRAAIAVARADPPTIVRGDLRSDVPALVAAAPTEATVVVFHSGVLAYLSTPDRAAFAEQMEALPATWISNEPPWAFGHDDVAVRPSSATGWRAGFVIAVGDTPVATTDLLGATLQWLSTGDR